MPPQVTIEQRFDTPAVASEPARDAHVAAPHGKLIRFAEPDEREQGALDFYDAESSNIFSWPNRPAGAVADLVGLTYDGSETFLKAHMVDALLKYFEDNTGSGSDILTVSGHSNRIRASSLIFKTSDAGDHSDVFLDRGVKVGDIARIRCIDEDDEEVEKWTSVKDFVGEVIAATIDAAESDIANLADQSADDTIAQTSGIVTCVTAAVDGSGYDGLANGNVTETYTIRVVESSIDGDLTTARLDIVSASGNDDASDVAPSAAGVATAIGANGLEVTFDLDPGPACSEDPDEADVSPIDMHVGQVWTASVTMAFTAPTATSSGTYTGTKDRDYIVEVVRGGAFDADLPPQIKVTTTRGDDLSSPISITAADTAFPVGSYGVLVAFDEPLRKGDRYHISAHAVGTGELRTLVLRDSLPTSVAAGTDVSLQLYIRVPELEIPVNRLESPPDKNYTTSATQITFPAGMTVYDSSWTNEGVEEPLEVFSAEAKDFGKLYLTVRYWLPGLVGSVITVADTTELDTLVDGPLHPDNTLKYAAYCVLQNSNGRSVHLTAIADPTDLDDWSDALKPMTLRRDIKELAVGTNDPAVQSLWQTHVLTLSAPERCGFRKAWFGGTEVPEIPLVTSATSTDEEDVLATLTDDTGTTGTQYTRLRVPAANGQFETNGVRPGDIVRYLYESDGFGGETYTEFTIDEVVTEDELLLASGHSVAVNVAQKIEIWRNLSSTAEAEAIRDDAQAFNNRRVTYHWPDRYDGNGHTNLPSYFLACAWAGAASGVNPHQGLTRWPIVGVSNVDRTIKKFTATELEILLQGGVWVTTKNLQTGAIQCLHAVTTWADFSDVNRREEMITRNYDDISYGVQAVLDPYIGLANRTPDTLAQVRADLENRLTQYQTPTDNRLGAQLLVWDDLLVTPHLTQADKVVVTANLNLPEAINEINAVFVVGSFGDDVIFGAVNAT